MSWATDYAVGRPFGGRLSYRFSRPVAVGIVLGTLATLVLMALALNIGDYHAPVRDVFRTALGIGDDAHVHVIRNLRFTRILVAVLVGAALALAGAVFQRVARNPLASPDVIGVTTGAGFVATLAIVNGWTTYSVGASAAMGGLATSAAVYAIAYRNGLHPARLILVGIGVTAALGGGTTYLVTNARLYTAQQAVEWQAGSLALSNWGDVRLAALSLGILMPVLLLLERQLTMLELGDELAVTLGLRRERLQLLLLGTAAALVGLAVAASGPIGFVALIAPHAARGMVGRLSGGVMVIAALVGASLLLISDVAAQHLLSRALPAGTVTAAVGAPYFLFLLFRAARGGVL